MKKIILAINNNRLEETIKKNNNIKIICDNLQYREAILEVLEENRNIDFILICEVLPGVISIEELIKKIKRINNKINIIFFLEKENVNKKNKLKNLNINNIFLNRKESINKIINLIIKNDNLLETKKVSNKIIKNNKVEKYLKRKILNKYNKIITIVGKKKMGKSTIVNLLLIYLFGKNKKILLIN